MAVLTASQVESRAWEEDSFANAILSAEAGPLVPASIDHEIVTGSDETPHLNSEWLRLCHDKGWFCRVCNTYPRDMESPLGYEDGLCPIHRLIGHAE